MSPLRRTRPGTPVPLYASPGVPLRRTGAGIIGTILALPYPPPSARRLSDILNRALAANVARGARPLPERCPMFRMTSMPRPLRPFHLTRMSDPSGMPDARLLTTSSALGGETLWRQPPDERSKSCGWRPQRVQGSPPPKPLRVPAGRTPRPVTRLLPLLLLLPLILSCTGPGGAGVNFDLAGQPTLYLNDWVRRGVPQVSVRPATTPNRPLTALFVPFRVTQQMEKPRVTGLEVSRQIWQTWLSEKVFPVIEFAENATPYRRDLALQMASLRGAQVLVGGYVTHYVNGGTSGDSRISVSMEIWDVQSGQLIWAMGHAGAMEKQFASDFILFSTRARMPSDPMWAIIQTVSRDLAREVGLWINPPAPRGLSKEPAF